MKRGFTLVELLVSIGLFSVIMTLSAGAYLLVIKLADRAQAVALTSDNLSFVLDSMTRSIRTGFDYGCPTAGVDCSGGATTFSFTDAAGSPITYSFGSDSAGGYVNQTYGGATYRLTDPSINITSLVFYLTGSGASDYAQPYVRMLVTGTANVGKGNTFTFSIQTSAVMRGIDI